MLGIIRGGAAARKALDALAAKPPAATVAMTDVKLHAPIPRPAKNVFCVGWNYLEHFEEGAKKLQDNRELPAVAGLLQQGADRGHRPLRPGALRPRDLHLPRLGSGAGRGDRPRRQEHQGRGRDEPRLGLHRDQRRLVARPAAPPRRPVAQGQEPRRHLPHGPGARDGRQPRPRQPARDLPRERGHEAGIEHEIPLLQAAAPHRRPVHGHDARGRATSSPRARPEGVGFARNPPEFLKPGDLLETEIEGIGTMRNPIGG